MALIGCLIVTHRRKAEDWLGVEAECPSASPGSWSSFYRHAGRVMRGSLLWIFWLSRQHLFLPGLFRGTCFTPPRSKIASFTNSAFTQKSETCRIYLWAVYFNHFLSFPLKQSFWSKIGWVTLAELLQQSRWEFMVLRNLFIFPCAVWVSAVWYTGSWRYLSQHREADMVHISHLINGSSYQTVKPLTCKNTFWPISFPLSYGTGHTVQWTYF